MNYEKARQMRIDHQRLRFRAGKIDVGSLIDQLSSEFPGLTIISTGGDTMESMAIQINKDAKTPVATVRCDIRYEEGGPKHVGYHVWDNRTTETVEDLITKLKGISS